MTGIANHAKKSEHEEFSLAVKDVSDAICGLVEAAAQAAYLVGVSDPSSVPGRPGLIDIAQFARATEAINSACDILSNPSSDQRKVSRKEICLIYSVEKICRKIFLKTF